MKLTFRGWSREVREHTHSVAPVAVDRRGYTQRNEGKPLAWNGPLTALGKVTDLRLTGDFLVKFEFEQDELRNWLVEFAKARPREAVRMLGEAHAEAIIALTAADDE